MRKMIVELGILNDGGVMMVSSEPLPHLIKRVEFDRDQRSLVFVYNTVENQTVAMEQQVPFDMLSEVENSPDVIVYSIFTNHEPIGYKAPLVKVGDLY